MPTLARSVRSLIWGGAVLAAAVQVGPAAALTITPYFDSSITGASDQSSVEGAIDDAIGTIDSLYSNAGTVAIVFSQASGNFLGQSETADYSASYVNYTAALKAVAKTEPTNTILSSAVATLASGNKPGPGGSVLMTSADARIALGQSTATGCFNSSGGFVNTCGQIYDGVVTITNSLTLNYGATPVAGQYSAVDAMEHEINEILGGGGQGSVLNAIEDGDTAYNNDVGVLDLYRYSAPGVASFTTSGSATSYFSVNGGVTDIVGFNQNSSGDYADFSTSNNTQSAFSDPGIVAQYNSSSPEYAMMESIGYDGVPVPEPTSLAVLLAGIAGLPVVRRRRRKVQ